MIEFSDLIHDRSMSGAYMDSYSTEVINEEDCYFKIKIHKFDVFRVYIISNHKGETYRSIYKKFSEQEFGDLSASFADIDATKTYVGNFILFLNKYMKLPAFL